MIIPEVVHFATISYRKEFEESNRTEILNFKKMYQKEERKVLLNEIKDYLTSKNTVINIDDGNVDLNESLVGQIYVQELNEPNLDFNPYNITEPTLGMNYTVDIQLGLYLKELDKLFVLESVE